MKLFTLLLLLCLCGCATEIYENGQLVCRIQSDATGVEFRTPNGTRFKAATINNSEPTKAGAGGAATVATAVGAAVAAGRVIKP